MPNITEYEAGSLAIRPSETGVEAAAGAGRRIGAFYNQGAEGLRRAGQEIGRGVANAGEVAVNYMDHAEINAGADHASTMFANLQDSWNKTAASADVHDQTVAQKWREETLEPTLDQFSQGFNTQKSQDWANSRVNTLRQHFFAETEGTMSHLSGIAAEETINKSINNYSNAVVSNPGALDTVLKLYKGDIETTIGNFPNMKGEDAAKFREEIGDKGMRAIVHAATMSTIMNAKDPEAAAAAMAKKYPDYVSGAEELQFAKAAKVQERMNLAYTKQAEAYQLQINKEQAQAGVAKIWNDNHSADPQTGEPRVNPEYFKQLSQLATQNPQAMPLIKEYSDWGFTLQARAEKEIKVATQPATLAALNSGMFDPNKPTTALDTIRAETAGTLSHQDGEAIRSNIKLRDESGTQDPAFKATMQAAKDAFTFGQYSADDPVGSRAYADFVQRFYPEYLREQREGTLKPNALNMKDPTSLISTTMRGVQPSLQQAVTAATAAPDRTIQRVTTKAAYDDLAPGSTFYDANGKQWKKPGPAMPAVPMSQ